MRRLLVLFTAVLLSMTSTASAEGEPQSSKSLMAAKVEGILLGLRALTVEPEWFPAVNDKSGLYYRLFMVADVATAFGSEIETHLLPYIRESEAQKVLHSIAGDLQELLADTNAQFDEEQSLKDVDGEFLQEQALAAEERVKSVIVRLERFLQHNLRENLPAIIPSNTTELVRQQQLAEIQALLDRVTKANSAGVTTHRVEIQGHDQSAPVLAGFADMQLLLSEHVRLQLADLRIKRKIQFDRILRSRNVKQDFNLDLTIDLFDVKAARYSIFHQGFSARARITAVVESLGQIHELHEEIALKLRYLAPEKKLATRTLDRFIAGRLRKFIATSLASANPEIGKQPLSKILEERCADLLVSR